MRRHLICLDGKKEGQYAFEWYLNNVNREGDEVVIFHCSQFQLNLALPGAAVNVEVVSKQVKDALQEAETITGNANQVLKSKGVKGYVIMKSGMKAEQAIMEVAQEEEINHIFMGTRDLGSIQRALIGSVSTFVARNSKVPVTIVKMPH